MPELVQTCDRLLECVRLSKLLAPDRLDAYLGGLNRQGKMPDDPRKLAGCLVRDGLLTVFQATNLVNGRYRNFVIGKYKILEPLGSGGMSKVYLAEHTAMGHRVALKVLPVTKGADPAVVGRFHREARAVAALNHPNIVRAHDIDKEGDRLHYITMDYVDGVNLHDLIKKRGSLSAERAAHYIAQAADGLQHIHEAAMVHRDIKPANLLLDRAGVVKILDLGLARFLNDVQDKLTNQYDPQTVLGTADFLSPEQALRSSDADIRSDVYSLGATLYYLLAGRAPFESESVPQKLICHQIRPPTPITAFRNDLPEGLVDVVETMMSKQAGQRYQTPLEVIEALAPWTETPIDPPSPEEIPTRGAGEHRPPHSSGARAGLNTPGPGASPTLRQPSQSSIHAHTPPPGANTSGRLNRPPMTSGRLAGRSPASGLGAAAKTAAAGRRKKIIVGIGGGVLLLVVLVAWRPWKSAAPTTTPSPAPAQASGPAPASAPTHPPVTAVNPADLPPPPPGSVVVAAVGAGPRFPTVAAALAAAKPGQKTRILIRNPVHHEQLVVPAGKFADVVIESGLPGAPITWAPPPEATDKPLLDLTAVEGLRVHGVRFDGQGRTTELIRVRGRCPDLVIEDGEAFGFLHAAVVFAVSGGTDSRPVMVRRFRVHTAPDTATGVLFESGGLNQFISLHDNRFEGPMAAAVAVAGPAAGLDVRRNRFWRLRHGLHYRPSGPPTPLAVQVRGNTFAEVTSGLEFAVSPPPAEPDCLVVMDNLFVQVGHLALLAGVGLMPDNQTPPWVWYPEFDKSPSIPAQTRYFRKTFTLPAKPTGAAVLNVGCDESFTVWVNGTEVGKSTSKFFSQRVYAIDVGPHLKAGVNTVAVEAANELDPFARGFGTAAGLMVLLTDGPSVDGKVLLATDITWKAANVRTEGWQQPGFRDADWPNVKAWVSAGGLNLPWRETVWDSVVEPHLRGQNRPIRLTIGGNVRDYMSIEGYPMLETKRTAMRIRNEAVIGFDPTDDARFLRYPATYPLGTGGTQQGPVGAPPGP
jgi:serine/threonine protein kinase